MNGTLTNCRWRLLVVGLVLWSQGLSPAVGDTQPGLWAQNLSAAILGGNGFVPVAKDYDGDAKADPAVYLETNGQWRVLLSGASYLEVSKVGWGGPGYVAVPNDYDGDSKTDPAVYLASNGAWQAWLSGADYLLVAVTNWGGPGFSPASADYDGDALADPAVYSASNGAWRAWLSSSGYMPIGAADWGSGAFSAVPADYDGDARADPAVYSSAQAIWRGWLSRMEYARSEIYGSSGTGDSAWPADYDGDKLADIALYTEASGNWKVFLSGSGYRETNVIFGGSGYQPVVGDFDGTGSSDIAVYQSLTGIWAFAVDAAGGRVFYVAATGSDSNDGSLTSPWATLGFGSRQLQPGDTLILLPGEYSEEVRLEGISGEAGRPIRLKGSGGGLSGRLALRGGLLMEACRHIVIEGLEIADFVDFGMGLEGCVDITVRGCYLHHNGNLNVDEMTGGYGIYVNGDGLVIENNTVTHNGALPSGGGGGGIEGYGMINTLIRSNECSFNFGNGILIEDSVATVAEYNTANSNDCRAPDGTWFAAALWLDGGHHVTVRRNRFDHNLGPGIEISDEESAAPYAYEVSSNNANSNYWGIYLWGFTRPAAEPINITGNTLSDNSGGAMRIEDLAASPEDLNIHIE